MGTYIQKKFQTAPVQAVTEPSLASNSDTNVPTIKAVNDGFARKQLLINNDFQINQRGQNEYIQDVNTVKYYIDMWALYTGTNTTVKITKLKKGIKIECTGEESELFQITSSTNENVACSIKINSISGNVDFAIYSVSDGWTNKVTNLKVGISSFVAEGEKIERVGIRCHGACILEIEYIDLFEGNIVYPHVKEDYTIALDRCQGYVRPLFRNFVGYCASDGRIVYVPCNEILEMKSRNLTAFDIDNRLVLVVDGNQLISTDYIIGVGEDYVSIIMNDVTVPIQKTINGWINSKIVKITCEPL